MPARTEWLQRIPTILEELAAWDLPVVDRSSCEQLFGVRRRRAIDLIRHFGGYQAGRTFLVDRSALIARLEEIRKSGDYKIEWQRKERLADHLDKMRRLQAAVRVTIPVEAGHPGLPDGVSLRSGALEIQFQSTEELLSKLFALAQAIANDYETFEKRTSAAVRP
jgi:hypothetical protein